jgi:hypothetical protein
LRTQATEPDWSDALNAGYLNLFNGDNGFESYTLPPSTNLIEEVRRQNAHEWNRAKISVNLLGSGGSAQGILGNLVRLFSAKDWLSLYRSTSRQLFAWAGRSVTNNDDLQILTTIEAHLFSVDKYLGNSEMLTVATWGKGQYGTLILYRATLQAREPRAQFIAKLGYMRNVPKAILRQMKSPSCVKLVKDAEGKIRCLSKGGEYSPYIAKVETSLTANTPSGVRTTTTPWAAGAAWRGALGIACGPDDSEALIATIPQMLAFVHLTGSEVNLTSTPPIVIGSEPLEWESDDRYPSPDYQVKRAVSISPVDEIDIIPHTSAKTRITVFFPRDAEWAKENILWV